jgi:hypothetical protein
MTGKCLTSPVLPDDVQEWSRSIDLTDPEARDVRKPVVEGDVISLSDTINDKLPKNSPLSFTKADVSAVTKDDGGVLTLQKSPLRIRSASQTALPCVIRQRPKKVATKREFQL